MRALLIIVSLLSIPLFSFPSTASDSLVNEGWRSWNENDLAKTEQSFLAAIRLDPTDVRGYVSLSYLYTIQNKKEKAWTYYRKVIDQSSSPYAYLFAAWVTEKFRQHPFPLESGIIELMMNIAKDEEAADKIQANAYEFLGEYYEKRGKLDESKKYFDKMKTISLWKLIGPFENISASGFDNTFPPETEFIASKTYSGKNDIPAKWFDFKTIRNDRWIDFQRYFGYDDAVFYANTFIYSKETQKVHVRIGTSGSLKAFLNDDLIIGVRDENNNDLDTYVAETELQQGWNRVLIKCGYSEINNCNFMFRITDVRGIPLNNIVVSTEEQQYKKHPGPQVAMIENFAERYFQQLVEKYPKNIENYLLLSDTYLRNDKASEAEEVVRAMMKLVPNCSFGYYQLIEVYTRGEKGSEVADLFEKLSSLDPALPSVLTYQYYQAMANEDYDTAERKLHELEVQLPGDKLIYTLYIDFYSKKKQVDKLIVYANEAYQKFPDEWGFVNLRAAVLLQTERKYEPMIAVIKNYLEKNYTLDGVYKLANVYLSANNVPQFEQEFNLLFELMPAAPGYYLQLAEVYIQLQQYPKAEAAARKAVEIAPGNSNCLEKLANILRMMDRKEEAKEVFKQALLYQPTRYDARESLRELEAKPNIFSNFVSSDIKSIVRNAAAADQYPNDAAVYLLDDTKRVVYPEGASEYSREVVVKVFNSRGIDFFKEYSIGYNSYSEKLIIEKAIVIKKDGTETKADINNNTMVFKSLEENDIVHMKWRVKNFYNGKLSRHFWDEVQFNGYLPYSLVRYSVLVPHGKQFSYRTQYSDIAPAIDTLTDGIRYTWTNTKVPSIDYEEGMPGLNDVGAMLHISSIPSWEYIVQWYNDLAKEKTRSSYEIKEQVKELFHGKENVSENEKISIIYNFITEKIRYSNVSFRQSSYIPQSARNVMVHKLGDCKDVATLCISMLNEVGIKAYHVLVNTKDEGNNTYALPSIVFNHCIVGVETSTGMKYYDLTAYNYSERSLPKMDQYAFALTIKPGEYKPITLDQSWFMSRNTTRSEEITLSKDNTVLFTRKAVRTGSLAGSYRATYRDKGKKDQEKEMLESLSDDYPALKINSFAFENLDGPKPDITTTYSFLVPNYVMEAGGLIILKSLWTDKFYSREALSYDHRNFAYNFYPGLDTVRETMSLTFDPKFKPVDLKPSTTYSSKFGTYKVTYAYSKGLIKGTREMVYKKDIVQPEEYQEFKEFYNKILREDEKNIVLKK